MSKNQTKILRQHKELEQHQQEECGGGGGDHQDQQQQQPTSSAAAAASSSSILNGFGYDVSSAAISIASSDYNRGIYYLYCIAIAKLHHFILKRFIKLVYKIVIQIFSKIQRSDRFAKKKKTSKW
jgi:hypothetical protein